MGKYNNLFRVVGVNDDKSECGLCGKTHLKKVVWLENIETGDINFYGTTCAAKMMNLKNNSFKSWYSAAVKQMIDDTYFKLLKNDNYNLFCRKVDDIKNTYDYSDIETLIDIIAKRNEIAATVAKANNISCKTFIDFISGMDNLLIRRVRDLKEAYI